MTLEEVADKAEEFGTAVRQAEIDEDPEAREIARRLWIGFRNDLHPYDRSVAVESYYRAYTKSFD